MKVSDILVVKGGTLFTAKPEQLLSEAVRAMAERDIGSLVVMEHGDVSWTGPSEDALERVQQVLHVPTA